MGLNIRQLLVLMSLLLGACASTKVSNSWTNPDYADKQIDKVLVLGVASNETRRARFEFNLASALESNGIQAIAGSKVKALQGTLSKEKVIEVVAGMDIDTIIVTILSDVKIDKKQYAGYTVYDIHGFPTVYGGYVATGVHERRYDAVVTEKTVLYLETSVYDAVGKAIIWRANTKTKEPEYRDVSSDLIRVVVAQLKRDKLIP